VPIILGALAYLLLTGDTWIRVVVTASIPIAPMDFAGYHVDTDGINIAYVGPLMLMFAIGAGVSYFITRFRRVSHER